MPVEITEATIREIRVLAEKAAPGPWFTDSKPTIAGLCLVDNGTSSMFPIKCEWHEGRFIAACDPQTVAALCDDWLRMRGAPAEIYEVAIPRTANPDVLLEEVEKLARSAFSQATGKTK